MADRVLKLPPRAREIHMDAGRPGKAKPVVVYVPPAVPDPRAERAVIDWLVALLRRPAAK